MDSCEVFIVIGNVRIGQQILRLNRCHICQRMADMHLRHHGAAVKHLALQLVFPALLQNLLLLIAGVVENAQPKGSAADQLENILRGFLLHHQIHQILIGEIPLVVNRQNPDDGGTPLGCQQQGKLLRPAAVQVLPLQLRDIPEDPAGLGHKFLTLMGGIHALIGAVEQRDPQLILQFLDTPAQGGLGDKQILGCLIKGTRLGNGYHIP